MPVSRISVERALHRGEGGDQAGDRVDAGLVAHRLQLGDRRQRALVAVAAAHHVDQRHLRKLRRLAQFLVVSREDQPHIGADIGGQVDAVDRLLQPLEAAGVRCAR